MKMTIAEVAQHLNLPESTIERWIRQGRIPIRKSGRAWVIQKSALEKWAKTHNLSFSSPKQSMDKQEEQKLDNLLSCIERGGVYYNIQGKDVRSTLKAAVDIIPNLSITHKELLLKRLIERERLTSTGIGKGVAIPHPRTPLADAVQEPMICTCFLKNPIPFNAIDDQPVFVMFILLSSSIKTHLHLLSRLAFCLRNNSFVEFLKVSPEREALLTHIANFEDQLESSEGF